jgi:hypothetical protein
LSQRKKEKDIVFGFVYDDDLTDEENHWKHFSAYDVDDVDENVDVLYHINCTSC